MKDRKHTGIIIIFFFSISFSNPLILKAWNDETHLAIAKAAGYHKWYLSVGADMVKIKARETESANHYFNHAANTPVTPAIIQNQIEKYNLSDQPGHLYGAIIHSLHDYIADKAKGKYGEYHLAFCAHYIGDLSMPFHNMPLSEFSKKAHKEIELFVNEENLNELTSAIKIYPIEIDSEVTLMNHIARIANISLALAHQLQTEERLITREEAHEQLSHSASLFKGILDYLRSLR